MGMCPRLVDSFTHVNAASPRQDRDFDQGHRAELHIEFMFALFSWNETDMAD